MPDGLLLDTYRVDGWSPPASYSDSTTLPASLDSFRTSSEIGQFPAADKPYTYVLLSSNVYYTQTSASAGAVLGMLAHSTRWQSNTLGQSTYYAYDPMGNTVATWVGKTWYTSAATNNTVNGWTVTINTFDTSGQAIDTYQGTYVDTSTGGTGSLGITITPATLGATSGSSGFADRLGSPSAAALRLSLPRNDEWQREYGHRDEKSCCASRHVNSRILTDSTFVLSILTCGNWAQVRNSNARMACKPPKRKSDTLPKVGDSQAFRLAQSAHS